MANVCVVITKQPQKRKSSPEMAALQRLAANNGLAQSAYPKLVDLAPRQAGRPMVVGPFTPQWTDREIEAVREVGFRRVDGNLVPIVHAKIMLLGRMLWTDEHPSGHLVEQLYLQPQRLWMGSANFTKSSRSSLEMGLWTSDPALLSAAEAWLLSLIAISEPLGVGGDNLDPELVPVEFDDAAIGDYLREAAPWEAEDDRY